MTDTITEDNKRKIAYALNLCTISLSQIIACNDVNIMRQEYDSIISKLNPETLSVDCTLCDMINQINSELSNILDDYTAVEFTTKEYLHKLNSAISDIATDLATADSLALATKVGIEYVHYRRNTADYKLQYDKNNSKLEESKISRLKALQKNLFEAALTLSEKYDFPKGYCITEQQVFDYNTALAENKPDIRYRRLDALKDAFNVYPSFWYHYGSAANSAYRSSTDSSKEAYGNYAVYAFTRYNELNDFDLLNHDILRAECALEYSELCDVKKDSGKIKLLIQMAENNSQNALDALELCAFSYLRINDFENAMRLFSRLVDNDYNVNINNKILHYKENSIAFYSKPIVIVYNPREENIAEYLRTLLAINMDRLKLGLSGKFEYPTRINLKEYKTKKNEYDKSNTHIILLGDSDEAESVYSNYANNGKMWEYFKYGMRSVSFGNKTVILLRQVVEKNKEAFLEFAEKKSKKYKLKIPSIATTPVQSKEWDLLRYQIAIYAYLERNNALYPVTDEN